jgi:hypothetical protein
MHWIAPTEKDAAPEASFPGVMNHVRSHCAATVGLVPSSVPAVFSRPASDAREMLPLGLHLHR